MSIVDGNGMLARRRCLLGPGARLFYDEPVEIVRGEGCWLWDAAGRRYLDCYNNVPHVGHCHPHVVDAIHRQSRMLNTHTRYLHAGVLDYVERLTATMGEPFSSAIMVNSGSEANDIALRLAETVTGNRGLIATNHTYHGNSAAVAQLSTTSPPASGYDSHVRHVQVPDPYRKPDDASGATFARDVAIAIASLREAGHGVAALVICPYLANEGFPGIAPEFFDPAAALIRRAGGLVIADEVQPGFGRLGSHMWGFQRIGLTPDVITLGKPMGNGHPVGAMVTSFDLLSAFQSKQRYFSTFGGNPVSCAAASAVLDVMERENLMQKAISAGRLAISGLKVLAAKHSIIGDVRGSGMFFGCELVSSRRDKTPDAVSTSRLVNLMRQRGVLLGSSGLYGNALKVRPPMCFGDAEVELFLATLDDALAAL
jgi:4-aminobutyrate aminotransferase-like enzyme